MVTCKVPPSFEEVCLARLKSLARVFSRRLLLGRRKGEGIFKRVVLCSLRHISIEEYCHWDPGMGADVVLDALNGVPLDDMDRLCNDLLEMQAREARKRRLFVGRDLSIDYYDVIYGGRADEHVFHVYRDVKGKMRPSHRYGLASVTGSRFFFALGILPMAKGDSGGKVVDWLLGRAVKAFRPGTVLMDRGFYSLEVFEAVEDHGLEYIVPGKSGDRIDELHRESLLGGGRVAEYMMYGKKSGGRAWKRLTVFFQEDPVFEYNAFFTNLKVGDEDVEPLARRYAKRGNVENNIKAKNHVKARTSRQRPPAIPPFLADDQPPPRKPVEVHDDNHTTPGRRKKIDDPRQLQPPVTENPRTRGHPYRFIEAIKTADKGHVLFSHRTAC